MLPTENTRKNVRHLEEEIRKRNYLITNLQKNINILSDSRKNHTSKHLTDCLREKSALKRNKNATVKKYEQKIEKLRFQIAYRQALIRVNTDRSTNITDNERNAYSAQK